MMGNGPSVISITSVFHTGSRRPPMPIRQPSIKSAYITVFTDAVNGCKVGIYRRGPVRKRRVYEVWQQRRNELTFFVFNDYSWCDPSSFTPLGDGDRGGGQRRVDSLNSYHFSKITYYSQDETGRVRKGGRMNCRI